MHVSVDMLGDMSDMQGPQSHGIRQSSEEIMPVLVVNGHAEFSQLHLTAGDAGDQVSTETQRRQLLSGVSGSSLRRVLSMSNLVRLERCRRIAPRYIMSIDTGDL